MASDIFAAKVVASGKKDGKPGTFECTITGENQTLITGKVVAVVAKYICTRKSPSGIYHIEELINLEDIINPLKKSMNIILVENKK